VFSCATATGDAVVTSTHAGRTNAFDAASGRMLWTARERRGQRLPGDRFEGCWWFRPVPSRRRSRRRPAWSTSTGSPGP